MNKWMANWIKKIKHDSNSCWLPYFLARVIVEVYWGADKNVNKSRKNKYGYEELHNNAQE